MVEKPSSWKKKKIVTRYSSSSLSNVSQGFVLAVSFVLHQYTNNVSVILVKNAFPLLGWLQIMHPRVIPGRLKLSCSVMVITPLPTIFQLYRGGQFDWWSKPGYQEETTDMSQVTDKLYHTMLYQLHFAWAGFELNKYL